MERSSRIVRYLSATVLLALAYFLSGKLGLQFAFLHASATPVWPPTGLAISAMLLMGYRFWPGIFLGAFLVNITTADSVFSSIGIATGNTLESIIAAYLIRTFANGVSVFDRPRDILNFILLAALIATTVSASFGVVSLALADLVEWEHIIPVWLTWWMGDAGGALVVTPFVLLWGRNHRVSWRRLRGIEGIILVCVLIVISQLVFGAFFPRPEWLDALSFLCIPVIVWAAFRFGQREAATVTLILSGIAIWGTVRGRGPFAMNDLNESLLVLQAFVSVLSVTGLTLAASVREQRRAAQELRKQTFELSRSNAALKHFSYAASHDLQEPLRAIVIFSELLQTKLGTQLDSETRVIMNYILQGGKRMSRLLKALLSYAQLTNIEKDGFQPIDCNIAFEEACLNLQATIEQSGAMVTHDPLPQMLVNRVHIMQLFQNLIGNAIKYRGSDLPRIHTKAVRTEDAWLFSVADNGIGIDRKYHEDIFGMFKRLQRDEKDGTGIGLTICQRIVEHYRGKIWVESELGKGSTFFFTLAD